MSLAAFWVTWGFPQCDGMVLCGVELAGSKSQTRPYFHHEGETLILSLTDRQKQWLTMDYALVEGIPSSSIHVDPGVAKTPPYLLTNDENMEIIFHGNIDFEVSKNYKHLLPSRGTVVWGLQAGDWLGILEITRKGVFKKKETFQLTAFSSNKDARVESGPVYVPQMDILYGQIRVMDSC